MEIKDCQVRIPIVRAERDMYAQEWHEEAVSCEKQKSSCNLRHAEALYNLKKEDSFKELGFKSWGEYIFLTFSKSEPWADKLTQVHQVFVAELNQPMEKLEEVGYAKLSMMASHVTPENIEETLEEMKDMTQKEITAKIKESKGLEPNETQETNDIIAIRIKCPKEAAEVIQLAAKTAKTEYAEETGKDEAQILEFQAYEIMAASYLATADLGGDPEETLKTIIRKMEDIHSIKISYQRVERGS